MTLSGEPMRSQQLVALLFGIQLAVWSIAGTAHDALSEVTYLGNEAVHFKHGSRSVLFDSFFTDGLGYYSVLDEETLVSVTDAFPPFDTVELVFVSHAHPDHFSASLTLQYLRDHNTVVLLAPGQVVDALLQAGGTDMERRLIRVTLTPGQAPFVMEREGVDIAAIAIPHKGGARNQDIENIAFRVSIDDSVTVAHFGDSVEEDQWFNAQWEFLSPVDVALIPYWFFHSEQGREMITSYLSGKSVIGIHVPKAAVGTGDEHGAEVQGDLFVDPGEVRLFDID